MKTNRILSLAVAAAGLVLAGYADEVSLRSAPPVVVKALPAAGDTDVDPALTEIRVTYSKAMQDGSWSWSTWGEENYPETTGNAHYLADGRTCVLPVKLQPRKFYALWLNSDKFKNFKDAAGQPAVPYLLTFRTADGPPAGASSAEQRLKGLVEDFFANNFRDVTSRQSIEWGNVIQDEKGNASIRYKYRAKIWDKDTVTNHQEFTFDPQDKFVSVKDVAVGGPPVRTVEINKAVSEFPEREDLSTPEAACAAWQRANARKDAQAVSRLSWVPLDPAQEENWFRRQQERDPEGLAVYLKAVAESKIVVVQTWQDDLAEVIIFLPFPPGKGRDPYSARTFGRINDQWKNLGEDRLPSLEAARENFDQKKARLWQQFAALKAKTVSSTAPVKPGGGASDASLSLLNADQRAVLDWTDRQFRSFFDARTFEGWSDEERANLEKRLVDALSGPRSTEYYQAINTLAALRSTSALPKLRAIAYERVDRNNRDRWMAIRALGLIGDKADVPELIHLVYHGNVNTHWWAQISLVRITGQNFAKDWNAWGKWWNDQNGQPPFKPEIIRWWNGQPEPDKLAESLEESDRKFLESLKGKSTAAPAASSTDVAARLRRLTPVMDGIRESWSAAVAAIQRDDATGALDSLRQLAPRIQEFREGMKGTSLEAGAAESVESLKPLVAALEKGDKDASQTALTAMMALGKRMEEQVKAISDASSAAKDPFANCRIASFGGDNSEGQQSYGGSGPAIRFKPSEVLSDARANEPVTLKGVRLYASRYGRSYVPEETKLRVILRDARDTTLAETSFAYAKFDYDVGWVDLVFDRPARILQPGESMTLAFDPEATQTKGIYFHYQKNPAKSHSLAGTVSDGFKELSDREWMVRVCFE